MSDMATMLRALPRNAEDRQVQAVRRRLFESTCAGDIGQLAQRTKLSREVVTDALILCADTHKPADVVHALWQQWTKVMALTGSSEYRPFLQYVESKVALWRATVAAEQVE